MKVYITGKDFKITVKDEGKKDIVLNGNTEVFDYLNKHQSILLGALDVLNNNNENYFNNAIAYLSYYAYVPNVKYDYNSTEISLNNNINLECATLDNLPSTEEVKKMAKKLKTVVSISPFAIYEVKSLNDVPLVCILHFSQYGYAVRRCKNCKKWFIAKTTKETKFCYRNDEKFETMICSDAYKYKERLKRVENDEIYKLHKRVYNILRNSYDRTRDEEKANFAKEKFEKFKVENAEKKRLLEEKKITENNYIEWLNSKIKTKNL